MSSKFYLSQVYGEQYLRYSSSLSGIEEEPDFKRLFSRLGSRVSIVEDQDEFWLAIQPPVPKDRLSELARGLVEIVNKSDYGSDSDTCQFFDDLPDSMQFKHDVPPNNVLELKAP